MAGHDEDAVGPGDTDWPGPDYDGPPAGHPDYAPCAMHIAKVLTGPHRTVFTLVVLSAAYLASPAAIKPPLAVVIKGIFRMRKLIVSKRKTFRDRGRERTVEPVLPSQYEWWSLFARLPDS